MALNNNTNNFWLYLLAFVEGSALMVFEIAVAKIIEPYFGSSLFIWASVLAMTLTGLCFGYFFGGVFSKKYPAGTTLSWCFLISGLLIATAPLLSHFFMPVFLKINGLVGIVGSCTLFLLPTMFLLGCVGPSLTQWLTDSTGNAGKSAGEVYAISTLGGVFNVLLAAFILMPTLGISKTCCLYGFILLVSGILLLAKKLIKGTTAFLVFILIVSFQQKVESKSSLTIDLSNATKLFGDVPVVDHKILYKNDGIFGKLKVVDLTVQITPELKGYMRGMLVNNTWQTLNNRQNGISVFDYVGVMGGIFTAYPDLKNVLHIGLGGGQVSTELIKANKNVCAVEIDARIVKLAKKYFNLSNQVRTVVDDGRHFINTSKNYYDIIVINAFNSAIPAWNLYTQQCFEKCFQLTGKNGILMLEVGGIVKSNDDKILTSMVKTLKAAGWKYKVLRTKTTEDADFICFAYKDQAPDFANLYFKVLSHSQPLNEMLINKDLHKESNAIVFTDDLPILSKWAAENLYKMQK